MRFVQANGIKMRIAEMGSGPLVVLLHGWGSFVAWHCLLLHPDRFRGLVAMSVPYRGRSPESPIEIMKKTYGDNFFYMLYCQEPGIAEKEFDADPRGILSRLYVSPDSPRKAPTVTDPKRAAGGLIARLGAPKGPQSWFMQADLIEFLTSLPTS
jgi:pimeloyl-ACP methyl ester carboxylesterase